MSTVCSRCGVAASGKFCSNCGSSLGGTDCPHCGGALTPGSQFCNHCGTSMSGGVAAPAPAGGGGRLPWIVAGVALVAVIALVLVQTASRNDTASNDATPLAPFAGSVAGGMAPGGASAGGTGGMLSAVDLAKMSPEEKADRLFNRVMMYASEGKRDSAAIFAPMAVQSFDMIGSLTMHQRFDVGLVSLASGDLVRAKIEAETILGKNPSDLLGLTLAIRVAEASGNSAARADYEKRLLTVEPAERKTTRQEYVDHSPDIDAVLKEARGRKK